MVKCHKTKQIGYGIYFGGLCTKSTGMEPVKNVSMGSLERSNIIDHVLNQGKKARIKRRHNKRRVDYNNNREIILRRKVIQLVVN